MGDAWPSSVTLSFDVGSGPANFTVHDPRLTVTEAADSFTISGLDSVNTEDVKFEMIYATDANDDPITVPAYDITVVATP